MEARSLLLAGSSKVVPALAMPPKAVRYCSILAASLPPSALACPVYCIGTAVQ